VIERPSVLIVSEDAALGTLSAALRDERILTETAETFADAEWFLHDHPAAICVIDAELPLGVAFQMYELAHSSDSRSVIILVTPETGQLIDPDGDGSARDECLLKSSGVEHIVLRLKALMILAGLDVSVTPRGEQNVVAYTAPGTHRGKITTVFSAKGGTGKTTIAVNVAVALAKMGFPTLLVDANLYFGDASILLNLVNKRSLMDLADVYQVDGASVRQLMVTHESGLSVLSSPPKVERVETLSTDIVIAAITAAATLFEHVIIDMHSSFDETNLQILDLSDQILLVTTPEVGATYNTARFLSLAETRGYRDRIKLILNRSESGIKPATVEKNLGTPVVATVVSAGRRAVVAGNQGVPLVLGDARKEQRITRDLSHIADLIAGDKPPPAPAPDPKRWLFGRKPALSSARSA
jgi:MinD-like ATPase involved in chromosome partitioning or flagellar assembly